ncbi:MAG TPA: 3-oxoacyl-ACP reductase family protein [Patescibacteria group bacterium]|nr:3-oxoacyl-ACP reductase family protein [Patescibacteria group bacterium]
MFDLTGKKALVTGASRGIGRGIALALAKQGADVIINCHSKIEEAQIVVTEIEKMGRQAFAVQADVSEVASVSKMFAEISSKWKKLDILVNNAGILTVHPFEAIPEEEWDKVINVNLKGQFLCSQAALKLMGPGGRIINMASVASGGVGIGSSNIAHYATSKGGSVALTEAMAVELGPKGINVNAIAPGLVDTDMTKFITEDKEQLKGTLARIPKGRAGKPEDIGRAAAFLASDEADYITGIVLYVDGGWLAS